MIYKLSAILLVSAALIMQGCAPVAVVGAVGTGAFVGSSAVEERGMGGVVSDTGIRAGINAAWLDYNPKIAEMVELSVREGKVLLTGQVDTVGRQIDAVRLAWSVKGVREVIDETKIGEGEGFTGYASDAWITAKLKAALVFESDIYSMNYTIKTVDEVVYLMGIAQNQQEIDRIMGIARSISGVQNVVNYARLKNDILLTMPESQMPAIQPGGIQQPVESALPPSTIQTQPLAPPPTASGSSGFLTSPQD